MKGIYIYLAFIVLLSSTQVFSQLGTIQERALKCSANGTRLLYVPGQENTLIDMEGSVRRISDLFNYAYGSDLLDRPKNSADLPKVTYDFLKNETLGFVGKTAIGDFAKSVALIFQSEFQLSRDDSWALAYRYFDHALALGKINYGKEITISPRIRQLLANKYKTVL
jgi:hypothetical protein